MTATDQTATKQTATEQTTTEQTAAAAYKWVGTRPVRPDGVDKVTGKAQFGADRVLPGMLEGVVARSPHAHARIVSIDTTAAAAMPGVHAVITGADFPDLSDSGASADDVSRSRNVMARDKVLYVGHVVAAVAAQTRRQARAAADAIVVEYDVLDHVLTLDQATADGAPLLHPEMVARGIDPEDARPNTASRVAHERGDLDVGFANADVIIERSFTTQAVHQGYIEPHAAVADVTRDGRAELWCSSQGHFAIRSMSTTVLGWELSDVKVTPAEIGGGFGGKTTIYLEPLSLLLSQRSGRPVRMVMDRNEVFTASGPTSGSNIRVKLGATAAGALTAADIMLEYEAGAFPGSPVGAAAMTAIACYDVPNFSVVGFDVVLNRPKTAAYRAPGAPAAAFAVESVLDEVARELSIDPIDLRLMNAAVEGTQASYGPTFPRIGFVETLEAIRHCDHYQSPLGPNQGRGIGCGFWFNVGGNSTATVNVHEDGRLTVMTGSPDIGGSRSSMALFAAEELGIDVNTIQSIIGDTDTIGFADVTGGSRVTLSTGAAVIEACREMREDLCRRAALMWDVDRDLVEWVDGRAQHVDRTETPLSLADVAAKAGRTGGPISVTAAMNMRGAGAGFSTQVVDVEIDPETGQTSVVRFTTAQDAGTAIHPSYVEGQMQGGVVQGIGWALNETYTYREDGSLDNDSFLDYRVPVASDLPMIDTIIVEVPNPAHPYGVRGVGEVGIVPTMGAVANAIHDAIGHRLCDLPMSPMRILDAINQGNG